MKSRFAEELARGDITGLPKINSPPPGLFVAETDRRNLLRMAGIGRGMADVASASLGRGKGERQKTQAMRKGPGNRELPATGTRDELVSICSGKMPMSPLWRKCEKVLRAQSARRWRGPREGWRISSSGPRGKPRSIVEGAVMQQEVLSISGYKQSRNIARVAELPLERPSRSTARRGIVFVHKRSS